MPPHSASLPYGERPATRCAKAVLFDLATGSMVISRSEIKMQIYEEVVKDGYLPVTAAIAAADAASVGVELDLRAEPGN